MNNTESRLKALCEYMTKEVQTIISQGCIENSSPTSPELDVPDKGVLPLVDYNTVQDMGDDYELLVGSVVSTTGYYNPNDKGGASYLISATATDYSIPLLCGLHAVYQDSGVFDVRSFGVIDNETLDQTVNLNRLMRYADEHDIYELDFHGFKIMTPDSYAGLAGVTSIVNGLWFDKVHHFKNLTIANNKNEVLKKGKCCFIFTPSRNPDVVETLKFTNVTIDAWVDNFEPWNKPKLSAYDGLRLGIFCYPRKVTAHGENPLFIWDDPDFATNFEFEFDNVHFKSAAHSYNISQAAIRSRKVIANNVTGESLGVHMNLDCVNLYADNVSPTIRYDLRESGRPLIMGNIHYEPEHGSEGKQKLMFPYDLVSLNNCHTKVITEQGKLVDSGQTLWMTAFAPSTIKKVLIKNTSGNVELQGWKANYIDVEVTDCLDHIWLSFNYIINDIIKVTKTNSVIDNIIAGRTGYIPVVTGAFVRDWVVNSCTYKRSFYYGVENIPSPLIGNVVFNNIKIDYNVSGTKPFSTNLIVNSFTINNSNLENVSSGLILYGSTIKNINLNNVNFGTLDSDPLITLRYLTEKDSTHLSLSNVSAITPTNRLRFLLSGTISSLNVKSKYGLHASTPQGTGSQTKGVNTLTDVTPQLNSSIP